MTNEEALKVLRTCEWASGTYDGLNVMCPVCAAQNTVEAHAPDCKLAEMIKVIAEAVENEPDDDYYDQIMRFERIDCEINAEENSEGGNS